MSAYSVRQALARAATVGAGRDGLNILVADNPRAADEAAAVAAASRDSGGILPLAGVPVAVKDNIATLDLPTTCGSRILAGYVSPFEATVVRRLRDCGRGRPRQDQHGRIRHGVVDRAQCLRPDAEPARSRRVPGGSSGGSAAAVAAGIVRIALGSETGGSVRQPASFCGVVGVKPTYGRVSRYGLVAFASSLDQVGVFGRSVDDAALALATIAGRDANDATSAPFRYRTTGPPWRAARPATRSWGRWSAAHASISRRDLDAGVRERCEAALDALRGPGRDGARCVAAAHRVRDSRVLHRRARRGVVQPGPLRRRALRPAGPGGRAGCDVRGHAVRRVRCRGDAAHPARHLRAVGRLLRCVLQARAAGPGPHRRRLPPGVRRWRRPAVHADHADARLCAGGDLRSVRDVPERHFHGDGEPRRCPRDLGSDRTRRRDCRSAVRSSRRISARSRCSRPARRSRRAGERAGRDRARRRRLAAGLGNERHPATRPRGGLGATGRRPRPLRDGRRARGARPAQDRHQGVLLVLGANTARPRIPTCVRYAWRFPGALPVLNAHAVELATRAAIALGCTVHPVSVFARKHYFYPDLPKGYQISQYDRPLATGGRAARSATRRCGITRVHLEEDAGKSIHDRYPGATAIDLNRAGVPLHRDRERTRHPFGRRRGSIPTRAQASRWSTSVSAT